MIYGTAWKKERTKTLVETALRNGFRAIDTANQPKHYTESLVGEALQTLSKEGLERKTLFLQTKFTPVDGQDSKIPYDPGAPLQQQVEESFKSSLKHLQTEYVDSYLLHGPYHHPDLGEEDFEVWKAMENLFLSGKTKQIGISNIHSQQLKTLLKHATIKPSVVQNRCFANTGWDYTTRQICKENQITYQGFSLLTANPQVLNHPYVIEIASKLKATPEQVIFKFSRQVGMVALTGTTDPIHMKQDLESDKLVLSQKEITFIEREFT